MSGRFTVDGLAPARDYTVCLVTYDGIRGSFFATQTVTTVPEPGELTLAAALVALSCLARARARDRA